jgi:hypothetical protein
MRKKKKDALTKFLIGLGAGFLLYQYLIHENVTAQHAEITETGAKGLELLLGA